MARIQRPPWGERIVLFISVLAYPALNMADHVRGVAEQREVPDAHLDLQHILGLCDACIVTLYGATRP